MLTEKSETVKVVVRCRPLSKKEISEQNECITNVDMKAHTIAVCNPANVKEIKNFTFDYTYGWGATQEQVFNETAKPILESVMHGYNGTIFAYGQTGTGKTFTMEGNDNEKDKGIIPRSIDWIFDNIKNYTNQQFLVRGSFVEIYNEEVRDLLSKNTKAKLNVREKDKVFYLEDVTVYQAENAQKMIDMQKMGRVNRATGATKMNPGSSRSHSIFTIIVEASETDENNETHYRVGKLNLVDLAGSERQSKTESTGERFKEATKINLSLTILGSVINKLVSGKTQYIPYRDSKLTMLLQDSLGGNTKTVMIANVGPADYNYDETLNTLWYASHAKKIKNKPRINEDPKDALLRQYQEEIEIMKKKLLALGKGALVNQITGGKGNAGGLVVNEENQIKDALENLEKEKEEFKKEHDKEIQKVKEQKNMAEEEKKKLIEKLNQEVEENQKKKEETRKLLDKYKETKALVLKGKETEKKVKQQEIEISKQNEELEIKKREEQRLQESLKDKDSQKLELKKKYEDKNSHLEDLNNKLLQLKEQIEQGEIEMKDEEKQFEMEANNWNEDISDLNKENKRYDFIISKFIPEEEVKKITSVLDYNSEDNTYSMNNKKAILNNYKTNIKKLKNMRKEKLTNSKIPTIKEDTINFQLEPQDSLCYPELEEQPLEDVVREIDNILRDDDSDLIYYDQTIHMITPNLNPGIVKISPKKIDSKNTTADSFHEKKFAAPVIKKK